MYESVSLKPLSYYFLPPGHCNQINGPKCRLFLSRGQEGDYKRVYSHIAVITVAPRRGAPFTQLITEFHRSHTRLSQERLLLTSKVILFDDGRGVLPRKLF